MRTLVILARMVKIEHSVFALPFAYIGCFLAARGWPGWPVFAWIAVAMVAVRSFAMTFNRIADLGMDSINPRTMGRPLVTGELSKTAAWLFLAGTAVVFVLACAGLNRLCLTLSPVALAWAAGYSYTKRFTWLCHFWLGSVLGLAPLAGWLGVEPVFTLPAVLLLLGVTFWVAGFDIIYSCQDVAFDKEHGLRSMPAVFGVPTALALSAFCHVNTALLFLLAGWATGLGWGYYLVWAGVTACLFWEHTIIGPEDMSRVNTAFFTINGVIAVALFGGVLLGL